MRRLKNKGNCLNCGRYFYESAYQDICPECIQGQELRDGEASPDDYEEDDYDDREVEDALCL